MNHQDKAGDTVLHQMALHGYDYLMRETLEANSKIAYIKNHHPHYPIHTTILNHQIECTKRLLAVKQGETLADHQGCVALHYAAQHGHDTLLEACCPFYSNLDIPDKENKTPLMLAAEFGSLSAGNAWSCNSGR